VIRALTSFRRLTRHERGLLWTAARTLALVRLALAVLRFPAFSRLASRAARPPRPPLRTGYVYPEQLAAAVARASKLMPAASCLARAFTLRILLVRHGHLAEVQLGVARGEDGRLTAHAWVESEGRVIGDELASDFQRLPSLPLPHFR
jgi:hypothetical protein